MSTLNICDRCETPATSNAMGNFTKRLNLNERVESLELCPGCVHDFVDFMNGNAVFSVSDQERPKAYKEPYDPNPTTPTTDLKTALRELLAGEDIEGI
jgi:hypothetical protein